MEYKPKPASGPAIFTRYKSTWDLARKSKHPTTADYLSSVPTTVTLYKPTQDLVRKPKHLLNANRGYLSPKIPSQSLPNGPTQQIVNAASTAAQSSSSWVHISWGNRGIPGSFAYQRFLEETAEEVAVQEGFKHAKILSTIHSDTCKGTKADSPHWVGEFGLVPEPTMIKAHVYVLPNHQRGKKHRGKRIKYKGYYERSALGDITYQKKWKPGVKHVRR